MTAPKTLLEMAGAPSYPAPLAHAEGVPVVHIVHHGRPGGGLFDPECEFAAIASQVAPVPGEPVVSKSMPNAFAGTGLDDQLKEFDRPGLIMAGFMTHMCVSSSARAAS